MFTGWEVSWDSLGLTYTCEEDGLIIRDLSVVTEAITWESQVVKTHLMINAQVRASRLSVK